MTQYTIDNIPDDYSDDEFETENQATFLDEIQSNIGLMEKFRICPICKAPLICFEFMGAAQRYICQNAHLLSVNEALMNN